MFKRKSVSLRFCHTTYPKKRIFLRDSKTRKPKIVFVSDHFSSDFA